MKIEMWDVDRLQPYGKNPRKYGRPAIERMMASIREHGLRRPFVVDDQDVLIIGHRQRLAIQALIAEKDPCWEGAPRVPVHVATGLPPAKVRALRIADNKVGESGAWDTDLLREELEQVSLDSFTGFAPDEIEQLLAKGGGSAEEPEYEVAPKLGERYDYVVIFTGNETDWTYLQELLKLKRQKSYKNSQVGVGRAVPFADFLEALRGAGLDV